MYHVDMLHAPFSNLPPFPFLDGAAGDVETSGIEIISVRVTKPRIPEQIRGNFEKVRASGIIIE